MANKVDNIQLTEASEDSLSHHDELIERFAEIVNGCTSSATKMIEDMNASMLEEIDTWKAEIDGMNERAATKNYVNTAIDAASQELTNMLEGVTVGCVKGITLNGVQKKPGNDGEVSFTLDEIGINGYLKKDDSISWDKLVNVPEFPSPLSKEEIKGMGFVTADETVVNVDTTDMTIVKVTTNPSKLTLSGNTLYKFTNPVTSINVAIEAPLKTDSACLYTLRFKTGGSFSGFNLTVTAGNVLAPYNIVWNLNTEYEVAIFFDGVDYTFKQVPLMSLGNTAGKSVSIG